MDLGRISLMSLAEEEVLVKRTPLKLLALLALVAFLPLPQDLASAQELQESRAHFEPNWRKIRRMGAGVNFSGVYGGAGFQVELNLTPSWGTQVGFGGTSDISAFAFQVKRVLSGRQLSPYLSSGVVHWASRGEGPAGEGALSPASLSSTFLSAEQKRAESFEEILIPLSLGLQYAQVRGPWAGSSVFVELNALTDVADLKLAATGTLGLSYFF